MIEELDEYSGWRRRISCVGFRYGFEDLGNSLTIVLIELRRRSTVASEILIVLPANPN